MTKSTAPTTIMRRSGVFGTLIFVPYDYVELTANVLSIERMQTPELREEVLFHEAAHAFRHMVDGDRAHWDNDATRYLSEIASTSSSRVLGLICLFIVSSSPAGGRLLRQPPSVG